MRYQVSMLEKMTIIADTQSAFRVLVAEQNDVMAETETAYGLGTLYKVKGGFVPAKIYVFSVVDKQDRPLADADLHALKAAIDFFFTTLLNTDLYIKEIPKQSSLFAKESARLYGTTPVAA